MGLDDEDEDDVSDVTGHDGGDVSDVTGHDGGVEVGEDAPEGLCMGQLGWLHINTGRVNVLGCTYRRRCI